MDNKIAVIYKSKYGSTKKYAKWIAEKLNADLLKSDNIKPNELLKYNTLIYGGSLHAVGIKGVKLITKNINLLKDKKIAVFAVGCGPEKQESIKAIYNNNFKDPSTKQIKLFYLRGSFNFQKLGFIDKIMMNMLKSNIQKKKEPLSEEEKNLIACYTSPKDWTSIDAIEPIINYVNS
ncbi:flavodoxin domain-containing protein [Clostridium cylindrosporum]|uniref:Flavodoxin n=1 Tax=Clostridium cylindrosporum DSM 605 TaxID=1121307 RepID=A0A0J8DCT4_CLOCY|nr:flavodoxin domain-containing protein [Clostridium cylindrosporum]KMT22064.1 flavodoxin [Clostridium cylindrosporum DSM 605]